MIDGKFHGLVRGASGACTVLMDHRIVVIGTVCGMIVRTGIRGPPAVVAQIFPREGIVFAVQVSGEKDGTAEFFCGLFHSPDHFHGVVSADHIVAQFGFPPEMGIEDGKCFPVFRSFRTPQFQPLEESSSGW